MSKEHAYAYEAGYIDGSTHYELEHCPACKNIADLQEALAENGRLRQEIKTLEWECEYVENMYQSVRSVLRNVVRTICATCPDKDMCERCYLRPYLYHEDGRYREEA